MTTDIRLPVNDTPIAGISTRIDELVNDRFRSLTHAILQLQQRTIIEPRAVPPQRAYNGQVELADGVNWNPANLPTGYQPYLCWHWDGVWYELLDDRHNALTPPLYLDNPHGQYWHKIRDAAWSHMYFQDFAAPKSVALGGIITNWTGNYLSDWQLVSDTTAGTISVTSTADFTAQGAYAMSVSGFIDGGSNNDTVVTLYVDGVATAIKMPALTRGTVTTAAIAWSGVVNFVNDGVLDLRVEAGGAGGIQVYNINWSMHRISPPAGTPGAADVGTNGIPPGEPIPPGWGGAP